MCPGDQSDIDPGRCDHRDPAINLRTRLCESPGIPPYPVGDRIRIRHTRLFRFWSCGRRKKASADRRHRLMPVDDTDGPPIVASSLLDAIFRQRLKQLRSGFQRGVVTPGLGLVALFFSFSNHRHSEATSMGIHECKKLVIEVYSVGYTSRIRIRVFERQPPHNPILPSHNNRRAHKKMSISVPTDVAWRKPAHPP